MKRKNPAAVSLGRLGGLAGTGAAKRRKVTSEQARKAINARWAKRKEKETMKLTPDQKNALWSAWSCLCSGGICYNSLEEMRELEKLGMLEMTGPPDEWPEAQWGYLMTDEGERIASHLRFPLSSKPTIERKPQ